MIHLGGFKQTAELLTELSGKTWTTRGIQETWKNRQINGFPDLRYYTINGKMKVFFNATEIRNWYNTRPREQNHCPNVKAWTAYRENRNSSCNVNGNPTVHESGNGHPSVI